MTDLPTPETHQGPEKPDPASVIRSRQFVVLLVLASIVGVIASVAAWAFLELIYYAQVWVYTDIPNDLVYDSAPIWWSLPILAIAGAVTALAIDRLPGQVATSRPKAWSPERFLPWSCPECCSRQSHRSVSGLCWVPRRH